ncbi:hypothetical protein C5167_047328 [Papaver somniferum]|uniref:Uncharacterized protein n=1 Tax=Papaver somniferum TaxID=3469 RepID=A0A4Y7LJX4_PAPSO|nr:hypothetical protein C5167_047328 [Papaver somniferum]
MNESTTESQSVPCHYTNKVAEGNIKALASCSLVLLQALADLFFKSPLEKRKYLKEAIGCLASISEMVEVKRIFISSLAGELENQGENKKADEQEAQWCVIMEFASALGLGGSEDLVYMMSHLVGLKLSDGIMGLRRRFA